MKPSSLLAFFLLTSIACLGSCRQKGPVEKAGEKVDKAIEKVEDTVNPKGPVEKAGEKVDKALGN